ncbi:hypothetical protein F4779DRAFT_609645 [Xylariaceae sp. FL0662B]|nr:hypothetical protein F4779DRAFT_609645 [Xylariaceae sp. FL0662B]
MLISSHDYSNDPSYLQHFPSIMSSSNSENTSEMNRIAVLHISAGDDDAAEVVIEFNGKRFAVSVYSDHSPPHATEDHLIDLLNRACTVEDNDEYNDLENEILDIIEDVAKPLFLQVAPVPPHNLFNRDQDLHSLLYPETLDFMFKTMDGKPTLVPISPDEAVAILGHPGCDSDLDFEVDSSLPQYSSAEVRILEVFARGSGVVGQAFVDGKHMLCKARETGLLDTSLERELATLQKLTKADLTSSPLIRVPRLLGYVKHAQLGYIIGLLREWIPSGLLDGRGDLRDMDVSAIPTERKQKWVAQMRETLAQLHSIGLFWGDGKISNIIIDKDDNAWLIDFGGGWTENWVDRELAGTVEGDEQALRNIVKFLGVDGEDTV